MKAPTQSFEPSNHVADADVRTPIYSNDHTNTDSRFSDENHYIYLYDGGGGGNGCNEKHKPNKNGIDSGAGGGKVKVDIDGAGSNSNTTSTTKTINSNSKIKNNINNNNNSNTSDNNEQGDESVVVLRHPSASMHSQKVLYFFLLYFPLIFAVQIYVFASNDTNAVK